MLKNYTFCPQRRLFCVDLGADSDYFRIQCEMVVLEPTWCVFTAQCELNICVCVCNFTLGGRVMAQAGEARIRFHFGLCECCGEQSGTGRGFPFSVSFHKRFTLIFIYTLLLPAGQVGESWEPSRKQCSFGNRGAHYSKVLSRFVPFMAIEVATEW